MLKIGVFSKKNLFFFLRVKNGSGQMSLQGGKGGVFLFCTGQKSLSSELLYPAFPPKKLVRENFRFLLWRLFNLSLFFVIL